jgi:hypothetical protein
LIVPLVVVGVEPNNWIIDSYPPEAEAPEANAAAINAARKRRGAPPVPEEAGDSELSAADLQRIALRVA